MTLDCPIRCGEFLQMKLGWTKRLTRMDFTGTSAICLKADPKDTRQERVFCYRPLCLSSVMHGVVIILGQDSAGVAHLQMSGKQEYVLQSTQKGISSLTHSPWGDNRAISSPHSPNRHSIPELFWARVEVTGFSGSRSYAGCVINGQRPPRASCTRHSPHTISFTSHHIPMR